MSAGEEASKVATSAIDAMKSSPALLALILMQILTMGMLLWVANTNNSHRQEREMTLRHRCLQGQDKL